MMSRRALWHRQLIVVLLLLLCAQALLLYLDRPAAAVPRQQEFLEPNEISYDLFSFEPGIRERWQPVTGNWAFNDSVYAQSASGVAGAASLYTQPIRGDYQLSAELRNTGTGMTGGLIFNAPSPTSLADAYAVRYADDGLALEWGYFTAGGEFFRQRKVALPTDDNGTGNNGGDGNFHQLMVTVRNDRFTVHFDDIYQSEEIQFDLMPTPYVGLFSGPTAVTFFKAQVLVQSVDLATVTPTATVTETPSPTAAVTITDTVTATVTTTVTPTVTTTGTPATATPSPTPSATVTGAVTTVPDLLEPGNTYILAFPEPDTQSADWIYRDGNWQSTIDEDVENGKPDLQQTNPAAASAVAYSRARIDGDYEFRARVQIEEAGADPHVGLIFNGTATTTRNTAYFLRFDGDHRLQWGHFVGESPTIDGGGAVVLDENEYNLNGSDYVTLGIKVTSSHYSISVNEIPVPAGQNVEFTTSLPRVRTPFFGLLADQAWAGFEAESAVVAVTAYIAATATPTLTPTPTWTPTVPTDTPVPPTSTPTFTPRPVTPTPTWTPTFTATPFSPLPTPTWTPSPDLSNAVITTPTQPPTNTPLPVPTATWTPVAQSPLDQAAQAANVALTATAQAASPLATPTWTPTWTPPPTATEPAMEADALESAPAIDPSVRELDADQTPAPVAILVTATPTPTQRPVIVPTPLPTPHALLTFARVIDATIAAAGWIWFMLGSLLFFTVAGALAGLSFRQREADRYALVEEPIDDVDAELEDLARQAGLPPAGVDTPPAKLTEPNDPEDTSPDNDDTSFDDWPPSLP